LFSVKPHKNISTISETNLIIIPSLNHDYLKAVKHNKLLIDWISGTIQVWGRSGNDLYRCIFMLAASGLLDGKSCSTHWAAADNFRAMFPKVNLQTDKLITDENGIYTNGGAYSFLNLVLYLIEKYYDRKTAIFCSKVFQIEMDRNSQSAFIVFSGQKVHEDEVVKKAQVYIENKLHERSPLNICPQSLQWAGEILTGGLSKATGNTPLEYSQRVKIEAAKKAFETSRKTINEVMYEVGYLDVKAFSEVFRKITGISPLEYRKKIQ
jgi:transcriptional regulator GlxA family with amidase domain